MWVPALAVLAVSLPCQEPEPAPRPDVLWIVLDDVNDWVGHLGGHPGARTPNIDRLAERGIAFSNAHCASPVCNPARTAMLGGIRLRTTKVAQSWQEVLSGVTTLPEHFAANGYRTLGTGKIYHGSGRAFFDDFHSGLYEGEENPTRPPAEPYVQFAFEMDQFDWTALDVADADMPDHRRASWAIEQLMKPGDEPLFLAVGFHKPHLPWYVPQRYYDLHPLEEVALPEVRDDDLQDLPGIALSRGRWDIHAELVKRDEWRSAVQAYLAACSFVDAQVGRVLDALDRSPRRDRTIVVLVSDHGWQLGEKRQWRKKTLWEDSTRVPLVIAVPGVEHAGARCSRPVEAISIYATLCDLAGLPTPDHVEGPSLVPLLEDPAAEWGHVALTTFEGHRSLRTERWRYIRYADSAEELYDHADDPHEFRNLAASPAHAEVRKELRARLESIVRER